MQSSGARVVSLIVGVPVSTAAAYLEGQGVDFGWAADDAENVAGPYTVLSSRLVIGTPWVGVIRTSDMTLYAHDDIWTGNIDIARVAQELAGD